MLLLPSGKTELAWQQAGTVAEFFAGIGLVRLGLENSGWKISFANDMDVKKYEMYAQNFPDVQQHFRIEDIRKLNGADIPTVSLATASFPCNDLSLAGSYRGLAGQHSSTIWEFIRILSEMGSRRPPILLLENVPSFLTSSKGKDFEAVLCALNQQGYGCDAFIVDAAWFVPQSRPRLFIVGFQGSAHSESSVPVESKLRPQKLIRFIQSHPNISWHVRTLPVPEPSKLHLADILEGIPHDSEIWWDEQRSRYLRNQMSEKHSIVASSMISAQDYQYGTVFRRVRNKRSMAELRTDGIAGCLRTPRGGSGRQILFKAGKGEYYVRLLTPRECARLQGVPDTYQINVPLNQALFGFGDAVCVPVIQWIAKHYLNPLLMAFRNQHHTLYDSYTTLLETA
jgi:DNA (cytosine-5)-methyltransferase 1